MNKPFHFDIGKNHNRMIFSAWKKWWSYFSDIALEKVHSDFGFDMQLSISNGVLKLVSPNAIYSYGLKYDNFDQTFEFLSFKNKKFERVLVLGGGMGSIVEILENKYNIHAHYDLIESDSKVAYLFDKYVRPDLKSAIQVYTQDGFEYMSQCVHKYDVICMDVFVDNQVPEKYDDPSFYFNVLNCLSPNGYFIYNRLEETDTHRMRNDVIYKMIFQIFSNTRDLKVGMNRMIIGSIAGP